LKYNYDIFYFDLSVSFKAAVINNSRNAPQFGEIQDAGDEGGDFVFIRK
jgi:hypothetical protein